MVAYVWEPSTNVTSAYTTITSSTPINMTFLLSLPTRRQLLDEQLTPHSSQLFGRDLDLGRRTDTIRQLRDLAQPVVEVFGRHAHATLTDLPHRHNDDAASSAQRVEQMVLVLVTVVRET